MTLLSFRCNTIFNTSYFQVRQFMNGIKNYLVKHGEGELEDLIERERSKVSYRIYPAIRRGFCPSRMTSNN